MTYNNRLNLKICSSCSCLKETYLLNKSRYYFRVKGWLKVLQLKRTNKQVGKFFIFISDKIDFKPKSPQR